MQAKSVVCQYLDSNPQNYRLSLLVTILYLSIGEKMKLNSNQKKVILFWLILIVAAIITWLGFGAEIFTKTKVLIENNDEIFGITKTWEDKFILGLDYTLGFIGIITLITSLIVWRLKSK